MDRWKQIQIHPRPTIREIDRAVQLIVAMPPSPEKDIKLSQAWYLALPPLERNQVWKSRESKQYFLETQLKYLGWIEEDFAILHIAITGETPTIF